MGVLLIHVKVLWYKVRVLGTNNNAYQYDTGRHGVQIQEVEIENYPDEQMLPFDKEHQYYYEQFLQLSEDLGDDITSKVFNEWRDLQIQGIANETIRKWFKVF